MPLLRGSLPDNQQRLIAERLTANPELTFAVLVLDREGDSKLLAQTIKSLGVGRNRYASTRILALTTAEVLQTSSDVNLRFLNLNTKQPLRSIEQALRGVETDWFVLVEAGSEFTPSGLLTTALDLLATPDCRAVYGDEIVRGQHGEMGPVMRPNLNLDLLLSLPAGLARHWLFTRQVWLDMGASAKRRGGLSSWIISYG